jgi:cytochrome b6-f complex iron-sulfur subunit
MIPPTTPSQNHPIADRSRRRFLLYLAGGASSSFILGRMAPGDSSELSLEDLCSRFPLNSRCKDYLPGVAAQDLQGKPIQVDVLLTQVKANVPVPVQGLPNHDRNYLVITDKPAIAPYAIRPICTHLGCTVEWQSTQNRFVCPCHGSQYDAQGRVVRGPARRSLPLVTAIVKQNQIRLVDQAPALDPR